jgi:acyl carrier protein
MNARSALEGVKAVIVKTLVIENQAGTLDASTLMFGSMSELDSLAVVELVHVAGGAVRIRDR